MAADEQRRRVNVSLMELKNLHTIVLDLEELKQLRFIAKRPCVRSILSREISNHEQKILSSSTGSDEKFPQEEDSNRVILAEASSKRKHEGIDEPDSSMMKKKPKLAAIRKPLVNESSCKNMEEEPHQQKIRTSKQNFQEKVKNSDGNEESPIAVVSIKTAAICDKMSQIKPSAVVLSASASRCGSSRRRSWCRICRVTHAVSKCWHHNDICSYCNKRGHLVTSCRKVPQDTVCPSGRRTVTAGGNPKSTQAEPNQQLLPTTASRQVLMDKAASSDVNKRFTKAVVGVENADVSEKPNLNTIKERLVVMASNSESTQEELNQQSLPTRTSEQVSLKKANPSDVNEAPLLTTIATETKDVSNEPGHTIASLPTTAAFRLACRKKWRFRHTCQLTDVNSDCLRCKGACFNCQKMGHIMANCPELPQNTTSPCGKIAVTSGSSRKSTHEEMNQQSLTTGASEQVLLDKVTSDVNIASLAVVANENADIAKKKPNLCTLKEPIVIIESSDEGTIEEPNQQSLPTKTSEQVLWKKANPSDVNDTSLRAVVTTGNANGSGKTRQTMRQETASLGSRLESSQIKKSCCRCKLPNHAESEGACLNATCLTCKMGHFTESCPKRKSRDAVSPSGTRTTAAGNRCTSVHGEPNQQPLPTGTLEQVLCEKTNTFDANEASPMTVLAIKNVEVTNKTSKTMTKGNASSASRVSSSQNVPWCCTCRRPASECSLNGSCSTCHEKGHSTANCPKDKAQVAFSSSGTGTMHAGSSCTSAAEKKVALDKKVPSDVNDTSVMAVVATKNARVSNKTSQSMLGRGPVKGKTSQISQEKTRKTTNKGVSTQASIAVSESKVVPSKKSSWCYTCKRSHPKSECPHHNRATFEYNQTGHYVAEYPSAHQRVRNMRGTNAYGSDSVEDALMYDWWLHGGAYTPIWVDPFQTWS